MRRRLLPFWLPVLFGWILSGCGESAGYRFAVQPTSGEVVYKGKPVAKAIVRFHPTDPKVVTPPEGQEGPPVMLTCETDEQGKFVMSTYVADDGIPAGDYVVTVVMGLADADIEGGDGKTSARDKEAGKIYREKSTTPLKATVKPGENRFTFQMK